MTSWWKYLPFVLLSLFFVSPIYAHPGNTASDGCHYCRTNCSSWGVGWDVRHCHNAKATSQVKSATTSTYSSSNSGDDDWMSYLPFYGGLGAFIYYVIKDK